ncbi:MAG TPA: nuclear transport factor 2 family protein [Caulobacteraceae bacterium]|jgi:ketosteroid isomerase-like protein
MTMTDPLPLGERAAIAWECERMIHHYAMLNDAGDFQAMAEMFAEDGVFARPSQGDVLIRGKAAILAAYTSRPARFTRHMITSVVVTVEGPDDARALSYLSLHTGQPGEGLPRPAEPAYLIGDFRDRFVREDGAWRFRERLGSLALKVGG